MGSIAEASGGASNIIDIRSDTEGINLKQAIRTGLSPVDGGERTLPTLLLYDVQGLKLFERITYLDEYYLTGEEIKILTENANKIAEQISDGCVVLELGSGNLRKIKILLDALECAQKNVSYYALDLMKSELQRTLAQVPDYRYVKCYGLHGTYDDGFDWLQQPENQGKPKMVLSLGSSIGNFNREEAVDFVGTIAAALGPDDRMLIAVDACQDESKIFHAYNDRDGVTHDFTANGLKHANALLGYEAFRLADWDIIGRADISLGAHQAFVAPKQDMEVEGALLKQGEKVRIEESYKYSGKQSRELWRKSGVTEASGLTNRSANHDARDLSERYVLHLLKKQPAIMFATKPEEYAALPVPSLAEWQQLWAAWDEVTRQMIPEDMLGNKPIKLRNACIFYLGHIPTFFDMKLTEATGTELSEPKLFAKIFERGIDPDVDNPEHCHAHSEIPDQWPDLAIILDHQQRVRERLAGLYKTGQAYNDSWTGRAIWLGFEHEVMHLETLLYMLLQSGWCRPPSLAAASYPDWAGLASQAHAQAVENGWFDIPKQTITVGLDDPDNAEGDVRHFGWDVEKPAKSVTVGALKAKGRPMTNGDYARFAIATGKNDLPASWITVDTIDTVNGYMNGDSDLHAFVQDKAVKTVYGPIALKYALDWPVSASYDELAGCALYMGGRIPTLEEARSIYHHADAMKKKEAAQALGGRIPAVNGHLSNDGVEETPPSKLSVNGAGTVAGPNPNELYVNLDEANVGFKHWHPMPVTQNGNKLGGQGDMGGLWEWTSSALVKQESFAPMKLYPAYSTDFFDDKHNVVLGGSWATHPRVAGRKSFVNWYQRNYPYVWAGARLVKDV